MLSGVPWLWLALGTALGETLRDLCLRTVLRHSGWSTLRVIGLSSALAGLLLLPLLLSQPQAIDAPAFTAALLLGGSLNALAFWCYGRAIAQEDLSLVLPLINLSPVALLLAGWWVLGERPGPLAVLGVALLVLGALLLGHPTGRPGLAGGGLGRLWASPGCRAMLLVALLWGIGASVDKLGVNAGGSLAWVLALQLSIGTSLLGLSLRQPGPAPQRRAGRIGAALVLALALAALAAAAGTVLQMEAIRQTAVVHVIAIKRLSTLMGSGAGVLALGEAESGRRLLAAALMLLGAATVLWGALG
ncbi:EamA family transporter [Cyanobium sp. ATX 6A2]|uniref:EamA family transporter n=1 Tax=Cyanobium sp. ATX 6A2 TaxID=2823700 RepID=UPI0020CCE548|nr:EamA family transporter [Cyanobium sp. ATX 6A2]